MVVHFRRTFIDSGQPTPAAVVVVLFVTIHCSAMASMGRTRTTFSPSGFDVIEDDRLDQQQWQRTVALSPQTLADNNPEDGGYVQLDSEMENTTAYERDTVRVKCDITGYPLPRYKWYKDGNPLDSPKSQLHLSAATSLSSVQRRFNVKTTPWGSRLKLSNVTLREAGLYTCEGFNQYGRQQTSGRLIVRPGTNPNRNRQKQLMDSDDDDYQFDPDTVDDISAMDLPSVDNTPIRRVTLSEVSAADRPIKTGQGFQSFETGRSSQDDNVRSRFNEDGDHLDEDLHGDEDDAEDGGFCKSYQGSACLKFIGNRQVYVRSGRKNSQLEEQLTALFKTTGRMSSFCADYFVPTLCYVAFPSCRIDGSAMDMEHVGTAGARGSSSADSRRGRVPKRRVMPSSSSSSSSLSTRLRQPLCGDECRVLDANNCRLEYITMITAAAAASSRRQQQSLVELLRSSWCPPLGDGELMQHPADPDCAHLSTSSQRALNITADLASSQLDHEHQLQRALTVVVPCAVLPLLIAFLLVIVRRCRRIQDQQQQQQQQRQQSVAAVGAPVKDPVRVVTAQQVALSYAQQLQQHQNQNGVHEQWTRRAPSLSHSDAACSWSSSHNEAIHQRQMPQTAAHLNDISPWNLHRLHAAVAAVNQPPPGYRVNVMPPNNTHHHLVHHQLPPYATRHQTVASSYQPELASSPSSHNYYHHEHVTHPYYYSRRPCTPASASTSGCPGGRSMTPKPSPTPSLSVGDHYGSEMQQHHSPAVTSYYGYDGGGTTWVGGDHQQPTVPDYGDRIVIGQRTSSVSGTDRSASASGRKYPA